MGDAHPTGLDPPYVVYSPDCPGSRPRKTADQPRRAWALGFTCLALAVVPRRDHRPQCLAAPACGSRIVPLPRDSPRSRTESWPVAWTDLEVWGKWEKRSGFGGSSADREPSGDASCMGRCSPKGEPGQGLQAAAPLGSGPSSGEAVWEPAAEVPCPPIAEIKTWPFLGGTSAGQ